MKRTIALILMLLLLCGVCLAEDIDLGKVDRIVYKTGNGVYRVIDYHAHFIGEDSEKFPSDRVDGIAAFMDHRDYGYVKADGTVLIPAKYDDVARFDGGSYAIVGRTDYDSKDVRDSSDSIAFPRKVGVLNRQGAEVVPSEYDMISFTDDKNYAIVVKRSAQGDMHGLYELATGKQLIAPQPYEINRMEGGVLVVLKPTGKIDPASNTEITMDGIMSLTGEILLPVEHDQVRYDSEKNAFFVKDGDKEVQYRLTDGKLVQVDK